MINKNVATYTDFLGKTNKKIVQAPGGASSLSLAWGNQKIDYGPSRQLKNLRKQVYTSVQPSYKPQQNVYAKNYSYVQHQSTSFNPYANNYGNTAKINQKNGSGISVTSSQRHFQSQSIDPQKFLNQSKYEQIDLKTPIKVMDFQEPMVPNHNLRKVVQQQNYTMNSKNRNLAQTKVQKNIFNNQIPMNDSDFMIDAQQRQVKSIKKPIKIGGQFGYSQTKNFKGAINSTQKNKTHQTSKKYQNSIHVPVNYSVHDNTPQQQIDLAVQEQSAMKSPISRRSNSVQNEGRSCIKIVQPPRDKLVLGDGSYNFWKQDPKSTNYIKKSSIIRTNKEFFNQKSRNY